MTSTYAEAPRISDLVGFYCGTYWAFLYSALDILAQVINQAMKLGLDEKKVSFKDIENKLQGQGYKKSVLQNDTDPFIPV